MQLRTRHPRLSFERRTARGARWLLGALVPFALAVSVALALSIRLYWHAGVYREAESRRALGGCVATLDGWLARVSLTNADPPCAAAFADAIARMRVARDDGTPVMPSFSHALTQLAVTTSLRMAEPALARASYAAVPLAALTNQSAHHVIADPVLANMADADPAVQIEIGWHIAADAARRGDTNRALAAYRLMADTYPHLADVHGFPVQLAAELEALKLETNSPAFLLQCETWADQGMRLDWRTSSAVRDAVVVLFNDWQASLWPRMLTLMDPSVVTSHSHKTNIVHVLSLILDPPTGAVFEMRLPLAPPVAGITPGAELVTHYSFHADKFAQMLRSYWLPDIAGIASNARVRLYVHGPAEPAPVDATAGTNIYGATVSLVPFDAAAWDARHQRRVLLQSAALAALLLVLIALGVRAGALVRAERSLLKRQLDFVAAVSHELRTPIASVRLLAETIDRGILDGEAEQRAYARLIMSESDRLTRLVNNILDIMMPKLSGYDVCRALREKRNDVPIIMLTARGGIQDRLDGFDCGADDYVVKPFSMDELLKRIEAVLRRRKPPAPRVVRVGDWSFDFERWKGSWRGTDLDFTQRELEMIELLVVRQGRPVSRDEFLDRLWPPESYPTNRTIDTHILEIRRKLDQGAGLVIETQHRVGYKLTIG